MDFFVQPLPGDFLAISSTSFRILSNSGDDSLTVSCKYQFPSGPLWVFSKLLNFSYSPPYLFFKELWILFTSPRLICDLLPQAFGAMSVINIWRLTKNLPYPGGRPSLMVSVSVSFLTKLIALPIAIASGLGLFNFGSIYFMSFFLLPFSIPE